MHLYYMIYVIAVFFGLILGFALDGVLVLIAGLAFSLVAHFLWHDLFFAGVVAWISTFIATYIFCTHRHHYK